MIVKGHNITISRKSSATLRARRDRVIFVKSSEPCNFDRYLYWRHKFIDHFFANVGTRVAREYNMAVGALSQALTNLCTLWLLLRFCFSIAFLYQIVPLHFCLRKLTSFVKGLIFWDFIFASHFTLSTLSVLNVNGPSYDIGLLPRCCQQKLQLN